MLMLSFDSPPPHWWLTPGGANATRLSNLPYSCLRCAPRTFAPTGANRCAVWLIPPASLQGLCRQVSATHSLRSGFLLFYCLTRGSATSSLHPALKAAVLRDSKFRSLPTSLKLRRDRTPADRLQFNSPVGFPLKPDSRFNILRNLRETCGFLEAKLICACHGATDMLYIER